MGTIDREQRIFMCETHRFVTVASTDGFVSCRGTPGHRKAGCEDCDRSVNDAMAYAGVERTAQ